MGAVAVALALALTACSDDGGDDRESGGSPTADAPLTEVTIDCPEFEDVAEKITDAQTELYSGTGDAAVIDDLVAELDALKEGAPEDVQTALDDMGEAFRDAAALLEKPTRKAKAELAALAPQLAEAGQTITSYITSECG
jgi:hypothetical protein